MASNDMVIYPSIKGPGSLINYTIMATARRNSDGTPHSFITSLLSSQQVLVPASDQVITSTGPAVTVQVDFTKPFTKGIPLVVATPYFRSLAPPTTDSLVFAASTLDVTQEGFKLYVERMDERLPWRDAMVLVSWIGE